jgi:hypothetical protein
MKLFTFLSLFLFLGLASNGQPGSYNTGNMWVHPNGNYNVGMDFTNTSTGLVMVN